MPAYAPDLNPVEGVWSPLWRCCFSIFAVVRWTRRRSAK
ncbi:hypothetical protein [Streptomyces sp. NBC_01719]|nr:hypothetical protein [Streptomyces sp. NBC_01719]